MELLILCICTNSHRTHVDLSKKRNAFELNALLHAALQKCGYLELSDYFVNFDDYRRKIEQKIKLKDSEWREKIYLVLDGPGGRPEVQKDKSKKAHPLAGSFIPHMLDKKNDKSRRKDKLGAISGTAFGHGWNRNCVYALTVLNHIWGKSNSSGNKENYERYQYYKGITPQNNTINRAIELLREYLAKVGPTKAPPALSKIIITGYSRGSVTAIKLARALNGNGLAGWAGWDVFNPSWPVYRNYKVFEKVPLNLFAADPVAGGLSFHNKYNHRFSKNVKYAVCPLSTCEDQNLAKFTPVNLNNFKHENSKAGQILFLPFAGRHGDIGFLGWDYLTAKRRRAKTYELHSAKIIFSMVLAFLRDCHTQIGKEEPDDEKNLYDNGFRELSARQVLELYSEMVIRKRFLVRRKNKILKKVTKEKLYYHGDVVSKLDYWIVKNGYVKDPFYFINEHHRGVFESTLPKTYKNLTSGKGGIKDTTPEDWLSHLGKEFSEEVGKLKWTFKSRFQIYASINRVYGNYPDLFLEHKQTWEVNGLENRKERRSDRHGKCKGENGTYKTFETMISHSNR